MSRVFRAGERQHAAFEREAKNDLRRGLAVPARDRLGLVVVQHIPVRGEQRESLIDDSALGAEVPNVPVPLPGCITADLCETRFDPRELIQRAQLIEGYIRDPKRVRTTGVIDLFHRFPRFDIGRRQPLSGRRPVQHVAVDDFGSEVFLRRRKGLLHLRTDRCLFVIGHLVVLPSPVRELGLQKEVVARHNQAVSDGIRDPLADRRFEIVLSLVRCIDTPEALLNGQTRETPRLICLPGRAVKIRR